MSVQIFKQLLNQDSSFLFFISVFFSITINPILRNSLLPHHLMSLSHLPQPLHPHMPLLPAWTLLTHLFIILFILIMSLKLLMLTMDRQVCTYHHLIFHHTSQVVSQSDVLHLI